MVAFFLLILVNPTYSQNETAAYRTWVEEMKTAPRGPFKQIRWFCSDGTIHPPKPYPCAERGGGRQHGEWSQRVKQMRTQGYAIANVLADIDPAEFIDREEYPFILKQILLEQFLTRSDDGWIFRRARYYRGALQAENEIAVAEQLLKLLAENPRWKTRNYFILREALRMVPHGRHAAPGIEMRQLARVMAEKDPGFESLRIKIHVKPDGSDAGRVRQYAAAKGRTDLSVDYAKLAGLIDRFHQPGDLEAELTWLAKKVADPEFAGILRDSARTFQSSGDALPQIEAALLVISEIRYRLADNLEPAQVLAMLDTSIALETQMMRQTQNILEEISGLTRGERLQWLDHLAQGLYGSGLISDRQRSALHESLAAITEQPGTLLNYKTELDYQARASQWALRTIEFHLSEAVGHLAEIEPLVKLYTQDRLHTSPLLIFAQILDTLQEDVGRLAAVRHEIFGEPVSGGLQALNPGLARGVLRFAQPDMDPQSFRSDEIYLLPETIQDLPRVAGILTSGQGNSLSHVQLLARNMGIPNVVISHSHMARLRDWEGRRIVMAVSPGGVVQLMPDGTPWDVVFQKQSTAPLARIQPDLNKLDLNFRTFVSLVELDTSDSGRIAGPKAANLAGLKQIFPETVTDGVVIPFGEFRSLLNRPVGPGGGSMYDWMTCNTKL
jgi:PEP-utilising enzyme, mobile domain